MRFRYAIVALIGVVVVVLAVSLRPGSEDDVESEPAIRRGEGMASLVPPPADMDELVRTSDVMVVGRIIEVVDERDEGPFVDNSIPPSNADQGSNSNSTPTPQPPLFTFTYYSVKIQHILADKTESLVDNGVLSLRISGSAQANIAFADMMPMPQSGDEFLFALMLNPDSKSFGSGPWGLIHLDGEVPRYNDWDRTPITFAEDMSPKDFVALLAQSE